MNLALQKTGVMNGTAPRSRVPMSGTDTDERKILSPFDIRECICLKDAAAIAGRSESTLRNWCDEHGLGRRVGGGTWSVSRVALAMFLDGDLKALRAYHAGHRTDPRVVKYFERAELKDLAGV
jgi:hypothetical protein